MSKTNKKANKAEYQRAMGRLEDAVKELGDAAKGSFADRAADVLEEAAAKLKSEGSPPSTQDRYSESGAGDYDYRDRGYSSEEGRLSHWRAEGSERPYRDLDNGVIWGICAGIAPYLGLKVWVVRLLAVTGLIYAGGIILPAYIISYFVLDPRSDLDESRRDRGRGSTSRRKKKRYARKQRSVERAEAKAEARAAKRAQRQSRRVARGRSADTSDAEPQLPARNVLRNVRGTLQEAELRLRRMEGHVTSGRYELQKELRKIDTT